MGAVRGQEGLSEGSQEKGLEDGESFPGRGCATHTDPEAERRGSAGGGGQAVRHRTASSMELAGADQ